MFFSLKHIVRVHPLMAIAFTALAVCAWIPDFISNQPAGPLIATVVLTILVGLALMVVMYRTGITRFYAALPYTIYVLLTAAFPSLHSSWQAQIALLGVALLVLLLYASQQESGVQRIAFAGTTILLLSSVLMPAVIWLIPTFWLALIYIHTLSLRGVLAALLAVGVFVLYFIIAQYFFGSFSPYSIPHPHWLLSASICSTGEVVGLMAMIAILLSVAIYSITRLGKEGSDMRFSVIVFAVILILSAVMSLFPESGHNNIPLVIFAASPVLVNVLKQKDFVI